MKGNEKRIFFLVSFFVLVVVVDGFGNYNQGKLKDENATATKQKRKQKEKEEWRNNQCWESSRKKNIREPANIDWEKKKTKKKKILKEKIRK